MEESQTLDSNKLTKQLTSPENLGKLLLGVVIASVVLGTLTGYIISQKNGALKSPRTSSNITANVTNPQLDTRTFKDFAEGTIKAKPQPVDGGYTEGTHSLIREGAVPVALTSSVVDLSKFEGKKVKVFGETQKALKEGWLMDIGKVDEIK